MGDFYVFTLACNFTKSNTPAWVFSRFLNYYNWYKLRKNPQIIQVNPFKAGNLII